MVVCHDFLTLLILLSAFFILTLVFAFSGFLKSKGSQKSYLSFVEFIILFDFVDFFERGLNGFCLAIILGTLWLEDIEFVFEYGFFLFVFFVHLDDLMFTESRFGNVEHLIDIVWWVGRHYWMGDYNFGRIM